MCCVELKGPPWRCSDWRYRWATTALESVVCGLCPFKKITLWARPLEIGECVVTALAEGDYMVEVAVLEESFKMTKCANAILRKEQINQIINRNFIEDNL